jgi:hypothetical protein
VFQMEAGTGREALLTIPRRLSFEHIGQHGSADYAGAISRAVPETQAENASLRRALESAPYGHRLNVAAARAKGIKETMGES